MSRCDSCKAEILWVVSESTGKTMPLDAEPSDDGNVLIVPTEESASLLFDEPERARVLGTPAKRAEARAAGHVLRLNHFVSCPNSAVHRKLS